ncbi:kelch repeat and BTB domain-containing protein 2-like [Branchiostoma lanceolatum]|uniref:kelch repeat and BTB domain-containing protein 2-like n=1 Tax=Branchiostoma lanceolatum TaxID=7740 RepID=UPI0034529BD6
MAAADQEFYGRTVRRRSYQDESYLHGFLGTVGDLQKAGVLQDVTLEVEGRRFPCHRLVLSAASPYFRAMFTSDMAESRQKTVVLQGLDAVMFGEILSYIYSGTLHVSLDKVQPLYQAADLLQLDYVRDTCSSYMAMNVERSTCVDLYKFAGLFSLDMVQNRCLQRIARHFTEVASSEEFCSLSVNQLTEIISHDELDVKEETTVWEAVVRWVQHSREDRLHHLPSILPYIRFNLLTSDNTAAILEHPLVREDPGSCEVISNVVQEGNSGAKPRLGVAMEMALLFNAERGSKELLFMNPREGKYISCSYKPEDLPNVSAMTVTSDNNIYILKTWESEYEIQLSLSKYNHANNVWEHESMSYVSKGRDTCIKDYLYEVDQILYYLFVNPVVDSPLLQVRKYDWHTRKWQECSQHQLGDSIYQSAALSCSPHLYFLTSTEMHRYDPRQDLWSERNPPTNMPGICTAVAMGTDIFCTDFQFTQTMVYDTESDCWQKLQGWSNPGNRDVIVHPKLFVLENQLHVLLGVIDHDSELLGQGQSTYYLVYVYDRSADTWRDLKATLPDRTLHVKGSQCPVAHIYLPYLKNGT